MGKTKFLDAVAFLFVMVICIFILKDITSLVIKENIQLFSVDSPLIFALLIGIGFAVCLVIVAYKEFKLRKKAEKAEDTSSKDLFSELKVVLICICIILAYIFTLKYLKFLAGTTIFMIISIILLNTSKDKITVKLGKAVIAAIIIVPTMYYVFHGIFNVMLP